MEGEGRRALRGRGREGALTVGACDCGRVGWGMSGEGEEKVSAGKGLVGKGL